MEDVSQELDQVHVPNSAIRPKSKITYLNDDVMPPLGHPDSITGHRNHYVVQP